MSRFLYLSLVEFEGDDGMENSEFGVRIFDIIEKPNIFSWNTMIRFFAAVNPTISVHYYMKMLREEIYPDKFTFTFLLQACGSIFDLDSVKQVHSHIIKLGYDHNVFVQNSILSGYICRNASVDAWLVVDEMSDKDVVTWTSLISGLDSQSNYSEAIDVFKKLLADDCHTHPNDVTIISTMSACGGLGSINLTKCLHSFLEKAGWLEISVSIANSLINAYAKCGDLRSVITAFNNISSTKKDLHSWTAIISAYGMHGRGLDALKMFSEMEQIPQLIPDSVAFVAILSACAHSGLIEEGLSPFESMSRKYSIQPDLRRYGCIVDVLGRAGMIKRAYSIIEDMPMEPNLAVLGSFLSSCRLHDESEFGTAVLQEIELLKERGGAPVLLSNMHANKNKWSKVIEIRKQMRGSMQGKPPAEAGFRSKIWCISLLQGMNMIHKLWGCMGFFKVWKSFLDCSN